MYIAAEDTDYCECCACKNIECKCVKNVNALLNSHAKEYKKQATISIIKRIMMYHIINIMIKY